LNVKLCDAGSSSSGAGGVATVCRAVCRRRRSLDDIANNYRPPTAKQQINQTQTDATIRFKSAASSNLIAFALFSVTTKPEIRVFKEFSISRRNEDATFGPTLIRS